jgi:hypothetical protein
VVAQPVLGRVADVWSFSASHVVAAGMQELAAPFIIIARRENAPRDLTETVARSEP